MRTKTFYEWTVEQVDSFGDIIETSGVPKLAEAMRHAPDPEDLAALNCTHFDLVLVRDVFNAEDGDLEDRQWAYVQDGELPEEFDGGTRVPAQYRKEFERDYPRD